MRLHFDTAKWVDGGYIGPSLRFDSRWLTIQREPNYVFVRVRGWGTYERNTDY